MSMNPYLTEASEPRTRAIMHEDVGNNALMTAFDATDLGNTAVAVTYYRMAAQAFYAAAKLREQAGRLSGGTELDAHCAEAHRLSAEHADLAAFSLADANP